MKRQIKFRGMRTDNGDWAYGYCVVTDGKHYIFTGETGLSQVTPVHRLMCHDFVRFEVFPDTVGQFTGLTDKNGKEIYEGDVLKMGNQKACVRYDGCRFFAWYTDCLSDYNDLCEIIGNIHDNRKIKNQIRI